MKSKRRVLVVISSLLSRVVNVNSGNIQDIYSVRILKKCSVVVCALGATLLIRGLESRRDAQDTREKFSYDNTETNLRTGLLAQDNMLALSRVVRESIPTVPPPPPEPLSSCSGF